MAKDAMRLPSTQGGLVRYNEEVESRVILKPAYVVGLIIALSVIVIALEIFL